MLKKRGMDHVDWAISLSIFILYLSWFFILIKPFYFTDERNQNTDFIMRQIEKEFSWQVSMTPVIIKSDVEAYNEPVRLKYDLGIDERNLAFRDNRYYTINDGYLHFLADLKKGSNIFWLVSSEENYTKPEAMFDLHATSYSSSIGGMRVDYRNSLMRSINIDGAIAIEDISFSRAGEDIDVSADSAFNGIMLSERTAETTAGYDIKSRVYAGNKRVYTEFILQPLMNRRFLDISMIVQDRKNFYSDNAQFGTVGNPDACSTVFSDKILIYGDNDVITFLFNDNNTKMTICDAGDRNIELKMTIAIDNRSWLNIYHEKFAIIKNGKFDEGMKYWEFVNNTERHRTCTSKEGTVRILYDDSDSFFTGNGGDWANSSISGFPVMGFGSDKAVLDGTGANYDGRLLSAPFIVPEYTDWLHIWRHFRLRSFDDHGGMPDGAYLEIVDAHTDGILLTIDSYEAPTDSTNYDLIGTKLVNISGVRGREVRLSLQINGYVNDLIDDCRDGSADDALVQIDDIFFSDAAGNEIKPGFNYTRIMQYIPKDDFEAHIGLPSGIIGLDTAKLNSTLETKLFGLEENSRINISTWNETVIDVGEIVPMQARVFASSKPCRLLDRDSSRTDCRMHLRIW